MNQLKSALLADLKHLALNIGERNLTNSGSLETTAEFIFSRFEKLGLQTTKHQFSFEEHSFGNIEALIPGFTDDKRATESIVIGAHYDTVPGSPGANDNGTGVVAVLALAEILKNCGPKRNIYLVAFANEESPYFNGAGMGSLNYAKACKSRQEKIVAMYSLETMGYFSQEPGSQEYPPGVSGYPAAGNFIAFVANLASAALLQETKEIFAKQSNFPFETIAAPEKTPGVSLSDHMSFWQMDYPAIMVTDTAPFRYPHYHTPEDTPDKIDLEMFTELVFNLGKTFAALAGSSSEKL